MASHVDELSGIYQIASNDLGEEVEVTNLKLFCNEKDIFYCSIVNKWVSNGWRVVA